MRRAKFSCLHSQGQARVCSTGVGPELIFHTETSLPTPYPARQPPDTCSGRHLDIHTPRPTSSTLPPKPDTRKPDQLLRTQLGTSSLGVPTCFLSLSFSWENRIMQILCFICSRFLLPTLASRTWLIWKEGATQDPRAQPALGRSLETIP